MSAPTSVTKNTKLITTGRLASRMSASDIAALNTDLQPHRAAQPGSDWLQNPPANLEVELGIGDGAALHGRALNNPSGHYLGAEIYLNGLDALQRALKKQPSPNLRVENLDGRDLLAALPAASVQRLLVLFPDPWPKSKHHKRRLLQPELLSATARALKPEGEFWLVTDWPDYALHGLALLGAHPQLELELTALSAAACKVKLNAASPVNNSLHLGPHLLAQPPAWWVPTKYQHKAARAGRAPWFIKATRKAAAMPLNKT